MPVTSATGRRARGRFIKRERAFRFRRNPRFERIPRRRQASLTQRPSATVPRVALPDRRRDVPHSNPTRGTGGRSARRPVRGIGRGGFCIEVGEDLLDHSRIGDTGDGPQRAAADSTGFHVVGIPTTVIGNCAMMQRSDMLGCRISLFKLGDGRRKCSLLGKSKPQPDQTGSSRPEQPHLRGHSGGSHAGSRCSSRSARSEAAQIRRRDPAELRQAQRRGRGGTRCQRPVHTMRLRKLRDVPPGEPKVAQHIESRVSESGSTCISGVRSPLVPA